MQSGQRRLDEESEAAEIHAENRDVDPRVSHAAGHRQQRTVAAEHDEEIDLRRKRRLLGRLAARVRRHQRRRRVFEDYVEPARGEPRFDFGQMRRRLAQMRFRDNSHAIHVWAIVYRRCRKNSWLPVAPVIGEGVMAIRVKRVAAAASVTRAITASWTAGSVTSPCLPTSSRPASNCGLTSATTSA